MAALGQVAFGEAGFFGPALDATVNLSVLDVEDRGREGVGVGEPGQLVGGDGVDEDVAVFVPFAVADKDLPGFEVDVGDGHVFDFGTAAAGGVEEADDEVVAFVFLGDFEEQADFVASEDGG